MSEKRVHDPLSIEVGALAHRAETIREQGARVARRAARALGWQDDYRRVFCDPATGEPTAAALHILRDLAREANFGRFDPRASDADLRMNEGSRRMLLHILTRLDLGGDGLLRLSRRMNEREDHE